MVGSLAPWVEQWVKYLHHRQVDISAPYPMGHSLVVVDLGSVEAQELHLEYFS